MQGSPAALTLDCLAVRDETPTIKTFVLRPRSGTLAFQPGQALTLELDVEGERLHRTFSIASAPGGDGCLDLTIKAHPSGRATSWLHRTLRPGMALAARGPVGRFVLGGADGRKIALVSAGSGATPLMSMLRAMAASGGAADVAWFHLARSPDEVLFAAELTALQRKLPGLAVAIAVTRPQPGWFGYVGRPGRRMLSVALPDLGRRDVYCCGPTGFMREIALIHAAEGGDRERFLVEHFGAAEPAPEAGLPPADPAGAPAFRVMLGARAFEAMPGETILAAATRQQVVIPCGCASGMCGTCRVRHVSGTVEMRHNGGLSAEEEASGLILACSSRPTSDLEIDFEA